MGTMHLRVVIGIFLKDAREAIRDGRILLALLLPIGLGVLYNFVMPETAKPAVTVAVSSPDKTVLPDALRSVTGPAVKLSFDQMDSPAAVKGAVQDKKADLGLVLPAGFDASLAAGSTPSMTLVRPEGSTSGADYVTSVLNAALRQMAGQKTPAGISLETVKEPSSAVSVMTSVGIRNYMVLATLIMIVAMIAIYVLPVLLTEEYEKKTADALLLVGTQTDIVAAKVLVGLFAIAVSIPLLLIVTRLSPANIALFAGALGALSVALIGVGLLLGALVKSVSQLNNWSSIPLLVMIMPAFFVVDLPGWAQTALSLSPGTQAVRMLVDGFSGREIYGGWAIGFAIIAAWSVVIYAVLVRTLARREA
jgi:hypothetical protein